MKYKIALIKGDGIGPEIVGSAVRVLQKAGEKFGHSFAFQEYLMGGCAIDASGTPLPEETVAGAVKRQCASRRGRRPKWDKNPPARALKRSFGVARSARPLHKPAPRKALSCCFRRSAHSARTSLPMGST